MTILTVIHLSERGLLAAWHGSGVNCLQAHLGADYPLEIALLSSVNQEAETGQSVSYLRVVFPDRFIDGQEHRLTIDHVNDAGTNSSVFDRTITLANKSGSGRLKYNVDRLDLEVADGWALYEDDASPALVELWADNHLLAASLADKGRPDLVLENLTEHARGFSFFAHSHKYPADFRKLTVRVGSQILKELDVFEYQNPVQIKLSAEQGDLVAIEVSVRHPHHGSKAYMVEVRLANYLVGAFPIDCVAGYGRHVIPVPDWCFDQREHVFHARIQHHDAISHMRWQQVLPAFTIKYVTASQVIMQLLGDEEIDLPDLIGVDAVSKELICTARWTSTIKKLPDLEGTFLVLSGNFARGLDPYEIHIQTATSEVPMFALRIGFIPELERPLGTTASMSSPEWSRALLDETSDYCASLVPFVAPTKKPDPLAQLDEQIVVIIPVYDGHVATFECIDSILKAQTKASYRLVILNDASPNELINRYLDHLEKQGLPHVTLIQQPENQGFVRTVNFGLAEAGGSDVIILNADTRVCDFWLDRILDIAAKDPMIGTITPMSNNGELVNVPYLSGNRGLDDLELVKAFDRAAAKTGKQLVTDIPVGIGFCMFVRRRMLDETGTLREDLFDRGYGEEVDLCLRGRARGWRNVMAHGVFVMHRGGLSFGDEKASLLRNAAKTINDLYPNYDRMIANTIKSDRMGVARRAINLEVLAEAQQGRLVMHVTHGYGGGTQTYVNAIAKRYEMEHGIRSLVLSSSPDGGYQISFPAAAAGLDHYFNENHVESFAEKDVDLLFDWLKRLSIARVHFHAPFGYSQQMLAALAAFGPYHISIHDYVWVCPKVTLTPNDIRCCGSPSKVDCNACIALNGVHAGISDLVPESKDSIGEYRNGFDALFKGAQQIYVGGKDVANRLRNFGRKEKFAVNAHPHLLPRITYRPDLSETGPVRVALIGGLSPIKGAQVLEDVREIAQEKNLPLEFILFGYSDLDGLEKQFSNFMVTGAYTDDTLGAHLERHRPHIAFFPNQWPETYSYTLSLALAARLWPVVSDIGVPAERIKKYRLGDVFHPDTSPAQICDILLQAHRNAVLASKKGTIDWSGPLKKEQQAYFS